ncbi:E3 ubiquitin-protein ligase RBBP6-like [Macrosteles quadrilineatus]|uniref:E3 ubiquitin-protein ligase RBBP6-like n=1 Tax=Macrosteles quadrilineatus TaxID=74068 RepID=UPI0023E2FB14|nr:E3 ubiquitin-protein ligase RBBP6-like [Macrosteles quadrilineatus]
MPACYYQVAVNHLNLIEENSPMFQNNVQELLHSMDLALERLADMQGTIVQVEQELNSLLLTKLGNVKYHVIRGESLRMFQNMHNMLACYFQEALDLFNLIESNPLMLENNVKELINSMDLVLERLDDIQIQQENESADSDSDFEPMSRNDVDAHFDRLKRGGQRNRGSRGRGISSCTHPSDIRDRIREARERDEEESDSDGGVAATSGGLPPPLEKSDAKREVKDKKERKEKKSVTKDAVTEVGKEMDKLAIQQENESADSDSDFEPMSRNDVDAHFDRLKRGGQRNRGSRGRGISSCTHPSDIRDRIREARERDEEESDSDGGVAATSGGLPPPLEKSDAKREVKDKKERKEKKSVTKDAVTEVGKEMDKLAIQQENESADSDSDFEPMSRNDVDAHFDRLKRGGQRNRGSRGRGISSCTHPSDIRDRIREARERDEEESDSDGGVAATSGGLPPPLEKSDAKREVKDKKERKEKKSVTKDAVTEVGKEMDKLAIQQENESADSDSDFEPMSRNDVDAHFDRLKRGGQRNRGSRGRGISSCTHPSDIRDRIREARERDEEESDSDGGVAATSGGLPPPLEKSDAKREVKDKKERKEKKSVTKDAVTEVGKEMDKLAIQQENESADSDSDFEPMSRNDVDAHFDRLKRGGQRNRGSRGRGISSCTHPSDIRDRIREARERDEEESDSDGGVAATSGGLPPPLEKSDAKREVKDKKERKEKKSVTKDAVTEVGKEMDKLAIQQENESADSDSDFEPMSRNDVDAHFDRLKRGGQRNRGSRGRGISSCTHPSDIRDRIREARERDEEESDSDGGVAATSGGLPPPLEKSDAKREVKDKKERKEKKSVTKDAVTEVGKEMDKLAIQQENESADSDSDFEPMSCNDVDAHFDRLKRGGQRNRGSRGRGISSCTHPSDIRDRIREARERDEEESDSDGGVAATSGGLPPPLEKSDAKREVKDKKERKEKKSVTKDAVTEVGKEMDKLAVSE